MTSEPMDSSPVDLRVRLQDALCAVMDQELLASELISDGLRTTILRLISSNSFSASEILIALKEAEVGENERKA